MPSVQQRKSSRQAPVARTALEKAQSDARADMMQEARARLAAERKVARDRAHLLRYSEYRREARMAPSNPVNTSEPWASALSFTAVKGEGDKRMRDFWSVIGDIDYERAFSMGAAYAAQYILFKRSAFGRGGGILASVARDMDFTSLEQRGVIAGFFWTIEQELAKAGVAA